MRFIQPKLDQKRNHKWFAIIPIKLGRETRWLEVVEVQQRYKLLHSPSGEPECGWYNEEFTN